MKNNNNIMVFISSPYTEGNVATNVGIQIDVFNDLMNNDFTPFAPLLAHFIQLVHPHEYNEWINLCYRWIDKSDCILRIKGESKGADKEVLYAESKFKRIFYDIDDLINYYKNSI